MSNEVVIDLNKSRSAKSYGTENIIQKDALKEVQDHIHAIRDTVGDHIIFLKDVNPEYDYYPREHNTITISGSRGSGKTSFILSVLALLNDKRKDNKEYFQDSYKELTSLGLVDPTIVNTKEHILVNVIARIKKMVYEFYKNSHHKEQCKYDNWKESLKRLAGGISQLDGVGSKRSMNTDTWDEPLLLMDDGLSNVTEGFNLEYYFHIFIRDSLEFIGKKAFVIAFDDIDTKFDAGWPVLEIIRMYLTTPQLIVILSGDLELFTTLIRNEQWKLFDDRCLKNDTIEDDKGRIDFKDQVNELEEQYLLKILPSQYRIELKTLEELQIAERISIKKHDNTICTVNDFFKDFIYHVFFYKSEKDILTINSHLMKLPIRSLVQLMVAFDVCMTSSGLMNNEFNAKLVSIFLPVLQNNGFDKSKLNSIENWLAYNQLAIKCMKNELDKRLLPQDENTGKNYTWLIINRLYTCDRITHVYNTDIEEKQIDYLVKQNNVLSRMVNYWIKVSYPLSMLTIEENVIKTSSSTFTVDHFADITNLVRDNSPLRIVRNIIKWRRENISQADSFKTEDSIKLDKVPKEKNIEKEQKVQNYKHALGDDFIGFKKIDDHFAESLLNKPISDFDDLLYKLPLILSDINQSGKSLLYASVLPIISFIPELIQGNIITRELFSFLEITESNPQIKTYDKWGNAIRQKMIKDSKDMQYPIIVWENIWDRFSKFLDTFKRNNNSEFLGEILHRQIIGFLNSVFVEEYLFRNDGQNIHSITLENPVNKDTRFVSNLNKLVESNLEVPVFRLIFSCPIWFFFLKVNENITKVREVIYDPMLKDAGYNLEDVDKDYKGYSHYKKFQSCITRINLENEYGVITKLKEENAIPLNYRDISKEKFKSFLISFEDELTPIFESKEYSESFLKEVLDTDIFDLIIKPLTGKEKMYGRSSTFYKDTLLPVLKEFVLERTLPRDTEGILVKISEFYNKLFERKPTFSLRNFPKPDRIFKQYIDFYNDDESVNFQNSAFIFFLHTTTLFLNENREKIISGSIEKDDFLEYEELNNWYEFISIDNSKKKEYIQFVENVFNEILTGDE